MNEINIIFPYKHKGVWVFDDENVALNREPFVAGIPEVLESITKSAGLKEPERGFQLTFSAHEFPGAKYILTRKEQCGGGYYYSYNGIQGWLCPALFKYFHEAPEKIYVQVTDLGD